MFSLSAAPPKQSVSDTINVLCDRLSSATLLEDRRAAILGLRSFAKDFPASVASGALRSLISSLTDDRDDADTVKIVLETLMMLFNPNDTSPEASDEIALWLADEFTQHQENTRILLDLMESSDFYLRLYGIQLLSAILSARTQRTEECVLNAPLGLTHLVLVLEDSREAVRNEVLNLLICLTPTSTEIQKLVAFQNAFERLFSIIESEGSLSDGGRIVEDCLILLANLLRRNQSNQSLFRESGCVNRLSSLLRNALACEPSDADVAPWIQAQRNRNIYAFLALLRLFLDSEPSGVLQNQTIFSKYGLTGDVLALAFSRVAIGHMSIRAEALLTCGDMIRDAKQLQESFAQFTIPYTLALEKADAEEQEVYVIDGLLDLILSVHDLSAFDLRYAACECLKAYLSNHSQVRLHFLDRAIRGFKEGSDESSNVLTALMRPHRANAGDPYRLWFACVIVFQLLHENIEAKAKLLGLGEGDLDVGEEFVSSIQTISAHLIFGIERGDDARSLVGYMMLLLSWVFEYPDSVNDFLAEASHVQMLIQAASQAHFLGADLVQGLSTMLLGVMYEFSTKDSPVPREKLHSILLAQLGRDRYLQRLKDLRNHPLMRDFEVITQKSAGPAPKGLPDVFFDADFVIFFKDNYSRIARAIDRLPDFEVSLALGDVHKGVSRELVDSLRGQVQQKDQALEAAQDRLDTLEATLRGERAENQRFRENAGLELSRARDAHDALEKSHIADVREMKKQQLALETIHKKYMLSVEEKIAAKDAEHQLNIIEAQKVAQDDAERARVRAETEIAQLKAQITKINQESSSKINELREENYRLNVRHTADMSAAETRIHELEKQLSSVESRCQDLVRGAETLQKEKLDALKISAATQSELDDLLVVFSDMEDRLAKYETTDEVSV